MPDARSPIRHHLVLYRHDPEQGRARFFSLMIERDLFGTIRLVRNWGFVGSKGQEQVEIFPDEAKAADALEVWAEAKRKRGDTDLRLVGEGPLCCSMQRVSSWMTQRLALRSQAALCHLKQHEGWEPRLQIQLVRHASGGSTQRCPCVTGG
jgi:predicted DNA-binding WGR domain protein